MSVEDLIVYGKKFLHSMDVNILLSSLLGYDTLELLTHLDEKVSTEKVEKYKNMIKMKNDGYPIQYIVGNVNFYGYYFDINPGVLIPRFETEQLVYHVSSFITKNYDKPIDIIDLGCGSGIIGITLSKLFPNSNITCLDISDDAILLTKKNAIKLDANINIIKGDMLSNINNKFDVIVSNPPYIKYGDVEVQDIVYKNEPHLALYASKDGLEFYDKILSTASKNLKSNFLIGFEIGYKQADDVIYLANKYLSNIESKVYKDLSGKDRIILICSNNFNF